MTDFIRYAFGVLGDNTAIPDDVQAGGSVSFQEGYGSDYSLDLRTDPDALPIEREEFNYLLGKITGAINFLQTNSGYPEYIPAAENGGVAFAYPSGARVWYSNVLYQAKEATSTIPTDATKWAVVNLLSWNINGAIKNVDIDAAAQIDATKIYSGNVTNDEFEFLDGVSSSIQDQLNDKQDAGDYITELSGDVVASGAGAVVASLSNTGVAAGFYPNANLTVDLKGRVIAAEAGPSAFSLYDSFEIWTSGLPDGWSSSQAAEINESALHVTQGTKSVNLNATGLVEMTKTLAASVQENFSELVLDVFIDSIGGSDSVSLSSGANTVSTPNGATGTFTLRCPVPDGSTDIVIGISGAGSAYVDNLRAQLKVDAAGVVVDDASFSLLSGGDLQSVLDDVDAALVDGGGAIELLETIVADNDASIEFTDFRDASKYSSYFVEIQDLQVSVNAAALYLTMSQDNGTTYLTSYRTSGTNTVAQITLASSCALGTNILANGKFNLYGQDLATSFSSVISEMVHFTSNATGAIAVSRNIGSSLTTGICDGLKIFMSSGLIVSSVLKLYAIKK